jgi:hypothetical protein
VEPSSFLFKDYHHHEIHGWWIPKYNMIVRCLEGDGSLGNIQNKGIEKEMERQFLQWNLILINVPLWWIGEDRSFNHISNAVSIKH